MQRCKDSIWRSFVVALALSLIASPISHALDTDFYSANNILYYDPTAKDCTTASTTTTPTLTAAQKIGQILLVGFDNSSISEAKTAAQKYQFAGIYLNIQDPSKLTASDITAINSGMKSQMIVASDDEGGQIYRMLAKGSEPSAKKLGTMTDAQVLASGKDTGTKLKKLGLTTVLGPVLDIDTGLKNAISPYDRSFSSNPQTIAEKAGAWANGVTSAGVGVTFKHFPGIGSNTGNTDTEYVQMTGTKTSIDQFTNDLIPYNNSNIKSHVSSAVMLANFALPGWGADPISVNAKAVSYLRSTVGYSGLVTTDDLSVMSKSGYGSHQLPLDQAVVKALNAKVDMPLFAYPGDAEMATIISAVQSNVDSAIISTAYNNVMKYKADLSLTTTTSTATTTTATSSATPFVSAGDNRSKIYSFLISTSFVGYGNQPFGPIQAAGAIGNFAQESGWNFSSIEKPSGAGHGIAQWSTDRWITLQALANSMGKPWTDPSVQFQMMKNELDGKYGKQLLSDGYDKLTDPKAAALMFEQDYEGAGKPDQKNRDDAAVQAAKDLAGIQPGTAFSSSTCSSTSTSSSAGSVTTDGFTVYMQNDPQWADNPYGPSGSGKTIDSSGCGPTSLAMIISTLTGKTVLPSGTARQAMADGMAVTGGSSWGIAPDLAKHYGLKASAIANTVDAINRALNGGALVSVVGKGPTGGEPFTSAGHFIVIRGVASNGQWEVGDSWHSDANLKTFDPATIVSDITANGSGGAVYAITK